LTILEQNKKNY